MKLLKILTNHVPRKNAPFLGAPFSFFGRALLFFFCEGAPEARVRTAQRTDDYLRLVVHGAGGDKSVVEKICEMGIN